MRARIYRGWDRKRGRPKDGRSFRGKGSPRGSEMAIGTEEKDVEVLQRQARFMAGRNFSQARIANQLGTTVEAVVKLLSEEAEPRRPDDDAVRNLLKQDA